MESNITQRTLQELMNLVEINSRSTHARTRAQTRSAQENREVSRKLICMWNHTQDLFSITRFPSSDFLAFRDDDTLEVKYRLSWVNSVHNACLLSAMRQTRFQCVKDAFGNPKTGGYNCIYLRMVWYTNKNHAWCSNFHANHTIICSPENFQELNYIVQ